MRRIVIGPAFILTLTLHAQFYPWGWGPSISVTQVGSTISCTVFDPVLAQSRVTSLTSVASWTHEDGVVATVSPSGIVRGVVYDIHLGAYQESQLSSNSGNTVINSDGIIAWVSANGIVGAAMYDPDAHQWRQRQLSSNSGNQIQNRDGVVTWVSSSGIVGAAVYDPGLGQWQDDQLSSNSGNTVQVRDGIVAWVSSSGTVGAAVYDPSLGQWVNEQLSSNSGNVLVVGQGVVAWKSASGILGGAAYDWNTNTWDDQQFSSSSSNTTPSIVDGTVLWDNSSGPQRYGYSVSGQWQSNTNTEVRCEYHAGNVGATGEPYIAYLWCLSIGASSYSHACGDGHTITRRWAWKDYANGGSYQPELTVFSATANSTCTGSVNFVGTAIEDPAGNGPSAVYDGEAIRLQGDGPLGHVEVIDGKGGVVLSRSTNEPSVRIPASLEQGIYIITITDPRGYRAVKRISAIH